MIRLSESNSAKSVIRNIIISYMKKKRVMIIELDKISIFSSSKILTSLSTNKKLKNFVNDIVHKHSQLSVLLFNFFLPKIENKFKKVLIIKNKPKKPNKPFVNFSLIMSKRGIENNIIKTKKKGEINP